MNNVSMLLAFVILVVVLGGLINRWATKKGIGWQFIRFNVIAISLPLTGLLALNSDLTGEAATIIAAAMGYCFGKSGSDE